MEKKMIQDIDVVSGFFQSGKTSFINSYIENEISKFFNKILIIKLLAYEIVEKDGKKFIKKKILIVKI